MINPSGKQCPFCKLINPASAQVCDCGYRFMGNVADPNQLKVLKERKAKILISTGVFSLGLGVGLTLSISLATSAFGFYVLFRGLIVVGLISLIGGIITKVSIRKLR